ncbi:MAG: prenyltransferase/squalene oxidase repeat-containing protein [Candidatus Nanoarchaeia archaeon]|nr:prenyltransferase/squalene oxidase repeat-containing protein [Candidatus Nanoarchaeia archaeon]
MKLKYIIFLLILSIPLSMAEVDGDKAFDYLASKQVDGSYNNNIIDTSAAILALSNVGSSGEVARSIDYLLSQKNNAHCWPKINCKVKETAFALLALSAAGEPTQDVVDWLDSASSSSSTRGKWLLQIANAQNGQCTINYNKGSTEVTKQVEIVEGKFPSCNNNNWLDLNSCLESSLLNKFPSLTFDIDCNTDTSAIIVLLFNVGNTYTFVENIESSSGSVSVDNNCFGVGFKDRCNVDSTLYASYALSKVDQPRSLFFLKSNYDSNNPEHVSLMHLITQDDSFSEELENKQRSDGSFDNNVFKTSLAVQSLPNNQESIDWLESKQKPDGSFGDVFETSFSLLSLSPSASVATCFDGSRNQGEDGVDCGGPCDTVCDICNFNDACDEERGEDSDNCPSDCLGVSSSCSNGEQDGNEEGIDCGGSCSNECPSCNNDGTCEYDTFGETSLQCPNDCSCEDNICDSTEKDSLSNTYCPQDCQDEICNEDTFCDTGENEDNCPSDCGSPSSLTQETTEEGASFPFFAITIIVILGLAIVFGIYYYSKKGKKKPNLNLFGRFTKDNGKNKKPFFKPEIPKFPGSKPSQKSKSKSNLDKELEKSLEEARKLIKKK